MHPHTLWPAFKFQSWNYFASPGVGLCNINLQKIEPLLEQWGCVQSEFDTKNFEWTRWWKRFVHKFHSNKTPKNPTIMIFDQPGQQLISTSICPAASLPCHLWTACLVHCGRALVLLVIQQWRLHFGWLSPLSAILKLELNWSTLYFSLWTYIMYTYVHIKFIY